MRNKIKYLSLLLTICLVNITKAQDLQWSLSEGFDFINHSEMHSHVQKSNSTYTIQTVPRGHEHFWFELNYNKLFDGLNGGLEGLPITRNYEGNPDYFYFPASYQMGIYFVKKDQVCEESSSPLGEKSTELVTQKKNSKGDIIGYTNNTSFAFEAALVLDNRTYMRFKRTKRGMEPDLDNLDNTATLVGFNRENQQDAFDFEDINFAPEKKIRLERDGDVVYYKYHNEVIFSVELVKMSEYRIVVALYSPLSKSKNSLMEPISLEGREYLTVDELFGLNPKKNDLSGIPMASISR